MVNIFEESGNVKVEGAGSLNTTALSLAGANIPFPKRLAAFEGEVSLGATSANIDIYNSTGTNMPVFGTSFYEHPDSSSGDAFGIRGGVMKFIHPPVM